MRASEVHRRLAESEHTLLLIESNSPVLPAQYTSTLEPAWTVTVPGAGALLLGPQDIFEASEKSDAKRQNLVCLLLL